MIVNLGCGYKNRQDDEIGFDKDLTCKPALCGNVQELPFKEDSLEQIRCFHVLEHVPDIVKVMNECFRVLKPGGFMVIEVPEFPKPESVADPTHVRFFIMETFRYFTREGALTGLNYPFNLKSVYRRDNWKLVCILEKPYAKS